MKHIILCADDYGQNSAISQAIIELIQRHRLSAASCMTASIDWPEHAKWLKDYQNQIDIGLHFNLTEGNKSWGSLSTLLLKSLLHRLDKDAIVAELNTQIDLFVNEMGCFPDFIDGHQHVHLFPVIRDALFAVYEKRLRHTHCYIRNVSHPLKIGQSGYIKQLIIQLSGANAFKKQLLQRKIPHNASFSGIYEFSNHAEYASNFDNFLNNITDNGLIMCHPGKPNMHSTDTIADARITEYAYLMSEQFVATCHKRGVTIGKFHK